MSTDNTETAVHHLDRALERLLAARAAFVGFGGGPELPVEALDESLRHDNGYRTRRERVRVVLEELRHRLDDDAWQAVLHLEAALRDEENAIAEVAWRLGTDAVRRG